MEEKNHPQKPVRHDDLIPSNDLSFWEDPERIERTLVDMAARDGLFLNSKVRTLDLPPVSGIDETDQDGFARLHIAARIGSLPHLETLLARGANPNIRTKAGVAPIHLALMYNHSGLTEPLLRAGADPNASNYSGSTPLHMAAWYGHFEATLLLLSAGANPHATDRCRRNPLHLALEKGRSRDASSDPALGARCAQIADILRLNGVNTKSEPRTGTGSTDTGEFVLPPRGPIPELPAIGREQKIERLEQLRLRVIEESQRWLNQAATQVVFGEGDPDAAIVFIGEAPGAEDDRVGRPFAGRAGQFLDKQIQAMGYRREEVYLANAVKLRVAEWSESDGCFKDRHPTQEEVLRGIHALHEQIEIVRPKAIITLGGSATKLFLGLDHIEESRGTWQSYRGIPVMPTLHPAFVLRNYTQENRGKVWSDLKKVKAFIA